MNIKLLALSSALIIAPSIGFAQDAPATGTDATSTETPAIATPDTTNPQAPVEGENSFTEEQAKDRIQDAGFTNVTGLTLKDNGIWEGTATKGADNVTVQLDYQGNVTTKTP
ncbi:PepSY domain-containing protein [Falsochrobactrum ovis]|uniref:YpeB-like protein with protease inhibitory function n=1 Tax=Falsochrobactrum ovis TaxID=1293442 RepID=A0A364JTN2_9HYPH|nr:PepSY domain-containing protein [Falsochrobactrum ovis]RAK26820.1 hypothetical protein C7374_11241 [Falsochrobactrum ovis]